MRILTCLALAVALAGAGCDRGKKKGKKGPSESGGPVAVGKLVITPPVMDTARGSARDAGEALIEQQIAALEGPDIRRQAEETLAKSRPEFKPAPVTIQVARVTGNNIVSVIGRGESPEYNAALVDAVMEAYVAAARPAEPEKAANATAESATAEKALKDAEGAWTKFRLENDFSRLAENISAAERRGKRLAVARTYYEQELELAGRLTIEEDIRRRQTSFALPQDMPPQLAAMVRTTLTVGELAYISALKPGPASPTSTAALEAARREATKDHDQRIVSNRTQLDIAKDLATTAQADLEKLQAQQKESERLQAVLKDAEATYRERKAREKILGAGLNDSVHPVVSITERASTVKGD